MKKFSRITAVLLIVLMLATMAVSCKKEDDLDDVINNGAVSGEGTGDEGSAANSGGTSNTGTSGGTSGGTNTGTSGGTSGGTSSGETVKNEGGNATTDENNSVLTTGDDQTVNEDFHIETVVTNNNGFIPDEEQGLEKSERRATEASKYNFDENPLINRDRQHNQDVLPSFNIDDTGFVRNGTKLSDLKGKTLMFYTSDTFAAWSYRDKKGNTIDEWAWFKQLKDEIGLSIKTTVSGHVQTTENCLKDMNAGKQMDIVYSSHVTYPASLCISRSITELININSIGSSPGVCKRTMDICKWGNTLRVVAPIGVVDVLWYNQTLTQELGLSDPHKMWEADAWDWAAYSKFMYSIPAKTQDGKELTANVHWSGNASYVWPSTTGEPYIYINADAEAPSLINNWDAASTMRCWEFITDIHNNINYAGPGSEDSAGQQAQHNGLYEGTTVMSGTMYTQVYRDTEYSKHVQINWVPYPMEKCKTLAEMENILNEKYGANGVKPAVTHDGSAQFCGFAMLLPKKTVKENNVDIALKFMELWATRFTETYFDNLNVFEYYNFNYLQRKQYFDFVTQNVTFGLAMNGWRGGTIDFTDMDKCFRGDPAYNVKTEATKISNAVSNFIVESLKYGQ